MSEPASLTWFARHELSLILRDAAAMLTGGHRTRRIVLAIVLGIVAIVLHLMANALIAPLAAAGIVADKSTLVFITGSGFLFWTVMLSQALESVTRAYYARSDLDLILSSPASARKVFAVRTTITAFTTLLLSCLLASPLINMLALHAGPQWLMAYAVLAALSALSTAIAVLVTIALFRVAGPQRTRFIAQIIAAIVGAGFIIGIQAAAILYYGNMSRFSILQNSDFIAAAPDISSWFYAPARAAMGNASALFGVALLGFGALAGVIVLASTSFGRHAIAAAGISHSRTTQKATDHHFTLRTPRQVLRAKEWKLLARDPWLLSQTLMQILYLVPPGLLLWLNFGAAAGVYIVVVPVLVMASGQLAGGLAWLAISGEDAHDLVVTAPVSQNTVLRAKIEAVLGTIAVILAPLLLLIGLSSLEMAGITALCAALSASSATAIQLWFRVPMRRAMFRRRQVASRAATISEAFASIMWAGTAALLAGGGWLVYASVVPTVLAILVVFVAWLLSPKGKAEPSR